MIHIVAIRLCIHVDESIHLEQAGVGGVLLVRDIVIFFDRLLLLHFGVRHSFLCIVVVAAAVLVLDADASFEITLLNQICRTVDLLLREVWALAPPPGDASLSTAVAYWFESSGRPLCLDEYNVRLLRPILLVVISIHPW